MDNRGELYCILRKDGRYMKKIICAILLFAMMFQLSLYAQGNKIIGNEQKNDLYEYGIMVGDGNGRMFG